MQIALQYQHTKVRKFFISRGFLDPDPQHGHIFEALREGSLCKLRHAIEKLQYPIDSPTQWRGDSFLTPIGGRCFATCTPVWVAALKGQLDIVKYLVNNGADTSAQSDLVPPVFAAASANQWKIVTFLSASGAHPDLEKISLLAWNWLVAFKNKSTALLIEKLDFNAFVIHILNSVDSADSRVASFTAISLVEFAMKSGKKEFMTPLFQGNHSSTICNSITSYDLLANRLLVDLVRNGYIEEADLIVASMAMPLYAGRSLSTGPLACFYERLRDILHTPGDGLETANSPNIEPSCSQELPQSTIKQSTVFKESWMKLINEHSMREGALQGFIDLGCLQCLDSKDVKRIFQMVWFGVLDQFGLTLHSPSDPDPERPLRTAWRYGPARYSTGPQLQTLFEYALYGCPPASFRSLVARPDVDLAPTNETCLKLFELAICNCRTETILWFLNNGFQADTKFGESKTPPLCLLAQSRYNETTAVNLLLERGASVHAADKYNRSALFYAAIYTKTRLVRSLLARGADPLQTSLDREKRQNTPLGKAVWHGRVEIVEMFLEALNVRRVRVDWLITYVLNSRGGNYLKVDKALRRTHWRMVYPVPELEV
ncbi:hypothetical protein N7471_009425 [Penicillium samsonianum]|uniref:uncharacterized protein n=1 Tax=Penicillium samsonianum TaxID=1882272 RepID=UPI002549260F|nr:uncharacterized protein N7471_009425 [Penicillium samsonianum]KAJ6128208.1 hypothetical protein N7471_009425 [Penicillium samsonianum]